MSTALTIVAVLVLIVVLSGLLWRFASKHKAMPCPSWLSLLLENPYVEWLAGSDLLLDRAHVEPGMWVLDVGSGPGRLSLPAAARVGPAGRVVALDIQPSMIHKLNERIKERGVSNLETILGGIGEGKVPPAAFDRALLVSVLGEIPDKTRALREIYTALKPGGILSTTEVFPDPHYQTRTTVRKLAQAAGFSLVESFGNWLAFTMNFRKNEP